MKGKKLSFDWKEYIEKRPDLKKNWNSPLKANVHHRIFSIFDKISSYKTYQFDQHWNNYLKSRPDLKKNWNSPLRACIHFHLISKYDRMRIFDKIPANTNRWKNIPEENKKILLKQYKQFKRELKLNPELFVLNPTPLKTVPTEEKNYVLFIPLYGEKKEARAKEFLECLDRNIQHERICKVVVFYDDQNKGVENDQFLKTIEQKNIQIIHRPGRLSYEQAFHYANEHFPLSNIIVANADIYLNNTLKKLDPIDLKKYFICLTRWNIEKNKKMKIAFVRQWSTISQDVWIFTTPIEIDFRCDLEMGLNHCDSFLNYHVKKGKHLEVINPCLDIQTCHLHLSNIRSDDLVELAKRNTEYVEEQAKLGNHDDSVLWRYL